MKLATLINSLEALKELGQARMKASIAFRVKKLITTVALHETAFNEARAELFKKVGEDSGNGQIHILPEHSTEFTEEFNALLAEEVEVNVPSISIDDLGDVQIEPSRLITLDWLIVE
jgi:hypothetical protein